MTTALDLTIFDVNRFGPKQSQAAWRDFLGINNNADPQVASYVPTITGRGGMTVGSLTIYYARYNFNGKKLQVQIGFNCTFGTTTSPFVEVGMPAGFEQQDVVTGDLTVYAGSGHADQGKPQTDRKGVMVFTEDTMNFFRLELNAFGAPASWQLDEYNVRFSAETEVREV